jgi:hypothetical protein
MSGQTALTPNYLLYEDGRPISTLLKIPHTGETATAVYGFSDKPMYDRFCMATTRRLTPFPLVKTYLRNQLKLKPNEAKFMALDASSCDSSNLDIATMVSVLDSLEHKTNRTETISCEEAND